MFVNACRRLDNSVALCTLSLYHCSVGCTQKKAQTAPVLPKPMHHCRGFGFRVQDFLEIMKLLQ